MKLVFYSGGTSEENQQIDSALIDLCKSKQDLLFTFFPSHFYDSDQEFKEIVDHYKSLGVRRFLKFEVDSHYSETLKKAVFKSDIIHLGGGNTYYFLKYLRKNNLIEDLKYWLSEGGILTGLSAGGIIMTPRIDTAGFPEFDRDDNEENLKNLKGMNLVDFDFFPHYKNSKRYDKDLLNHSKSCSRPIYACSDGAGIIVTNDEVRFIGKTACFSQGKKFFINK